MVNALTEYQFHLPFTSREKIGEKNITNANLIHPFVVNPFTKYQNQLLTIFEEKSKQVNYKI